MANKEAKAKKENKNKKSFFKDFKAELKKVSWPTPKQLVNNTTAVVTIVIITAVIVFALDVVFETLNKHGVDKIKEVIGTENTVENTNTENTTEDTNTNNAEGENTTVENPEASSEENTEAENNAE
jgi:preprotein translocase subunit SecE